MITLKEYDFNNNISTKLKKEKNGTKLAGCLYTK